MHTRATPHPVHRVMRDPTHPHMSTLKSHQPTHSFELNHPLAPTRSHTPSHARCPARRRCCWPTRPAPQPWQQRSRPPRPPLACQPRCPKPTSQPAPPKRAGHLTHPGTFPWPALSIPSSLAASRSIVEHRLARTESGSAPRLSTVTCFRRRAIRRSNLLTGH